MMVSFLIISFSLLLSSTIILSDDYLENLSVNTGETATFICDLPEKYSNKHVSSHAIYHLFFSLSIKKKKISIINMITWSSLHLGNIEDQNDIYDRIDVFQADFYGPTGRLLIKKIDEDTASDDQTRFILEHTYVTNIFFFLN